MQQRTAPPPPPSADSVSLAPERYTVDALLCDKYVGYSSELLRVSLLLLGGLGWMLAPGTTGACIVQRSAIAAVCFGAGTLATIAAAACALIHRYIATDAVAEHIYVLRHQELVSRAALPDRSQEAGKVQRGRARRRTQLKRSGGFLIASAACLVAGVALSAVGGAESLRAQRTIDCPAKTAAFHAGGRMTLSTT